MKASFKNIHLQFKFPAGTSRGILKHKPSSFIILENEGITGIGECSTIPGLSIDPPDLYQHKLNELCNAINEDLGIDSVDVSNFPSIAFGLETALLDLKSKGTKLLFESKFTSGSAGIPINGLVWMGDKTSMEKQVREKIDSGYHCIKLKVGALDFQTELEIIADIRRQYSSDDIEIRLDANGGFKVETAIQKLEKLAVFDIHSIEQPIQPGQYAEMAELCRESPIPIVLDEELIGIAPDEQLLSTIQPAYIILKPALLGGLKLSEKWIELANKQKIGWWITSALESNVGLNAIAQWTSTLNTSLPQGLGTGMLYHNNIPSPLEIRDAQLFYNINSNWDFSSLQDNG